MIDGLSGQDRALLFLVPIPADDGGQTRIYRDTRSPAIKGRIGFEDGWNAMHVLAQPLKCLLIPAECDGSVIVQVDGCFHISGPINGFGGTIFEAVAYADRSRGERG